MKTRILETVLRLAYLFLGLIIAHLGVTLFLLADLGSDPYCNRCAVCAHRGAARRQIRNRNDHLRLPGGTGRRSLHARLCCAGPCRGEALWRNDGEKGKEMKQIPYGV